MPEENIQAYLESIVDAKFRGSIESLNIKVDNQAVSINNLEQITLNYQNRIETLESQNTDLINRVVSLEEQLILITARVEVLEAP